MIPDAKAVFVCVSLLLSLLGRPSAQAQSSAACTVFVVGGSGPGPAPALLQTLQAVRLQADSLGRPSTLIVLDDRLGRTLLPPAGHKFTTPVPAALLAQLHSFPGRLVVVPSGFDDAEQAHLSQLLAKPEGRAGTMVLEGHCPGPVELVLDAEHTLVVLNTAWWLRAPVPGAAPTACEAQDPAAVLTQLNDILRRNQGRHVLLVGQAPLARASWSLPLLPNPGYQLLRRSLRGTLEHYPGLTYIGGHSRHHARYDEENALHYFVSSAAAPVGSGRTTNRSSSAPPTTDGFTRLDYAANGQVRASYWLPDQDHPAGKFMAERRWMDPCVALAEKVDTPAPPLLSPTAVVRASTQYKAGSWKIWLQGANYRREWQQPVRVPVLNLAIAHGGLTPLRPGGGYQTKSLRLRAADGQEFVLRSVEKNTSASVPDFLHDTFAAAIVQDQISAAHPYAALAVPPLAEAAGVGHTNPELVLVPDDALLGVYRRDFAGTLALLEARDPTPPRRFTGQPLAKHYSSPDVIAQLKASARNRVDQRALLRARLLDLVLADWDRHDDQWRWLAYPQPGGGKLFRALPRDRDQAFFVNEGVLPRRASVEYLLPRLQGFANDFRNVNSFNFQARYFDHSFLTELNRADWQALADSVQASLTDAVLAEGLRQWPDSIYRLSGPAILAKLQAHRARLPAWADQYYHFLAQAVDVVGSDEPEEFAVVRASDELTQVTVYARPVDGTRGPVRYQRTFHTDETGEIRLYGQGGADLFTLSGHVHRGPVVRVVGGEGLDTLRNASQVSRGHRKIMVYDSPGGLSTADRGPNTALRFSTAPNANQYNRTAFQYPYAGPLYPWSYNVDDGLFIGAGLLLKRPGFHKEPWAATHQFTGNVALRTGAFNFAYEGLLARAVGLFDLQLRGAVQAPNYVCNFYGFGNETRLAPNEPTGAPYYRVRFRNLTADVLLRRAVGQRGRVFGGFVYQGIAVESVPGRIFDQLVDGRLNPGTLFSTKQYLGVRLGYELTGRHAGTELPQGVRWQTELLALRPLSAAARPLTQLTSALAFYRSFRFPVRLTLATRFGGTVNFGEYEFFQAASLGGLSNLRGFGRTRFAGRQSAYNNTEVRWQLARFRTYLLPATFGVLAFHDVGRVWLPGEGSGTWHRGYGPGLWLAPTPQVVIAAMYGISAEANLPLVRLGFFF